MKQLTPRTFLFYWNLVEDEVPLTDFYKAKYHAWKTNFYCNKVGMSLPNFTCHGIVRGTDPKGIFEASFKRGKGHGLYRWISGNTVKI